MRIIFESVVNKKNDYSTLFYMELDCLPNA